MLISFKDYPGFTPNLTPRQIFEYGSFGGGYFRDIENPSHSGTAALTNLPPDLWQGIDKNLMLISTPDKLGEVKGGLTKSLTLMVGSNGIAIFIMAAGYQMMLVKYKDGQVLLDLMEDLEEDLLVKSIRKRESLMTIQLVLLLDKAYNTGVMY